MPVGSEIGQGEHEPLHALVSVDRSPLRHRDRQGRSQSTIAAAASGAPECRSRAAGTPARTRFEPCHQCRTRGDRCGRADRQDGRRRRRGREVPAGSAHRAGARGRPGRRGDRRSRPWRAVRVRRSSGHWRRRRRSTQDEARGDGDASGPRDRSVAAARTRAVSPARRAPLRRRDTTSRRRAARPSSSSCPGWCGQ